jgi:2'-5' RNA ligase
MSEYYRCFIAVVPDDSVIEECIRLRDRLDRKISSGFVRWCSRQQLHLTLKFFGNVEIDKIEDLKSQFANICGQFNTFDLSVENIGAFPDINFPRVIWLGVKGEIDKLMKMQATLDSGLSEFGDNKEDREFKPHLTLARIKNAPPREQRKIGESLKEICGKIGSIGSWKVKSVVLMQSILDPAGAVYQVLEKVELK